jgi:hypothetical protein
MTGANYFTARSFKNIGEWSGVASIKMSKFTGIMRFWGRVTVNFGPIYRVPVHRHFLGTASSAVPGSLTIEGERGFHLLLKQKMELLPPFLSNEPGTRQSWTRYPLPVYSIKL